MGKPKNKSKGQDVEDLSDIEVGEKVEDENKPVPKQSKKEKRKKKNKDDWEDNVASEIASLSLNTNTGTKEADEEEETPIIVNKKEKKKKKKQKQEDSDEEQDKEIMPSNQKSKKKAAFSMLMMEDEGSDNQMNLTQSESEEDIKLVVKQEPEKKKKKEKKKQKNQEEDIDALLAEIEKPKEKSGGKKSKKDKKKEALNEDMETEQLNENGMAVEESSVEMTEPKAVTMEDLEDEDDKKKKKKKKGKENKEDAENTPDTTSVDEVEKVEPKVVTMEDLEDGEDDKKKKKKKKGKREDTDNTADTYVTEEVEKIEPKVVTMEDLEDDEEDEKKKKKKKKTKDKDGDEEKEGEDEEEGGEGTMKTAAQKRKEKKEREKEKKKAEKMKQAQKKDKEKTEEKKLEKEKSEEKEKTTEEEKTEAAAEDKPSGDEAEEEGKRKKKDKKKKGEKEEKKEDKKKKTKAPVAAIKEMLKKQKEEEERLKKEEEERIRKEEEAIAAALEKKRIEEERKQRKKEKEKEKRERLKAEGKLLTAQQKADKKRAMQMLEMMKAQGIRVPNKDDAEMEKKKRPVYGVVRKKKKQEQTDNSTLSADSESREDTPTPTVEEEKQEAVVVEKEEKKEKEDQTADVKDEWDDDVKDEWDASSEEEEEESEEKESSPETETRVQVDIKPKEEVKKGEEEQESEEEEDESDDDDDDEEEDDSESEEESETESDEDDELTPYERAEIRIKKNHEKCETQRTTDNLRAPVVCVLGHVDTGKTKILDKLRRTNVQDGEAGGITQQIGATNVPKQAILDKTVMCKEFQKKELKLPGLLIIDTPGHESFSNLRSRGSSLCDIAILVIDIMHGLEPQTIESINLLKDRKTPFVVALNKIDRLYQWKSNPNVDVFNTIKKQTQMCRSEFDERSQAVIVQLAEQGLNAALFYENKNPKEYISLVPTSAHSGDGMGNLLALICDLTQTWLAKKVSYTAELHATVMEVKALPGLGTTIDVILVNGKLCEGDQIVIAGTEGPIVTQIRGLLMPQPMRELRVKAQYEHHKEVMAAQGVKIIGKELEKALAGLPLYVAHNDDEVEYYKEELSEALKDVLGSIKLSERGVFVQASTLGSLEALLEFLRTSKIPYAGINIGPVHKKDIMKASIMLEHDSQWAVILAFDVKVERDAQEMADSLGVRIFTADIIYHLEDKFLKFREDLKRQKQEEFKHIAVFPCKLRVLPQFIFNQRDPIVLGVSVEAGVAKVGTPICVPSKEFVEIGTIASIENNHKSQETARRGEEVCVKIENTSGDAPKLYGRHFDHTDLLVSKISRTSIDAVKDHFREEMTKQDWALMVELKKTFQIL